MFFYNYNKLTPELISAKLGPAPVPANVSPTTDELTGQTLKVVTDGGPVLEYRFESDSDLILSENGGPTTACRYGAMKLRNVILLTHLISGASRGYNVILDTKTSLVTVFEMWFCGYSDNREVQRQIYYGYAERSGCEPPTERHTLTNRLECKGFCWTDDRGVQLLTFYPSVIYSSFVEISRPRGGITITAPSDYIKIDEHMYIYSRVECEFSGTMVLEVIDLFGIKQAGMRLGFDENDELDYILYKGTGKITGQAATFESFLDHGEKIAMETNRAEAMKAKGTRPVYRPKYMHPEMTEPEVHEAVQKKSVLFGGGGIMPTGNQMHATDYMAGKKFMLRFDDGGPVFEYELVDITTLRIRFEGEAEWHTEQYRGFEVAEDLIMFSHIITDSRPNHCITNAVDFKYGLCTCIDSQLGNGRKANEVGQKVIFGVLDIEGVTPPDCRRHQFTNDLVGKSFTWNYSDSMSSIHVYSSPESYSWTIFLPNNSGGMMWSSPCKYMKLRDYVYMFTWVEETCNGSQGSMVFNTQLMHDCGFFYAVSHEGLNLSVMGAFARTAGVFDILPYFDMK